MKIATTTLRGVAPYSQSRHHGEAKKPKELSDEHERRTWRHRLHRDKSGHVVIPGTAFANAIKEAVKRLKIQVPGMGKLEYTKYFEAGIMVPDCLTLPVLAEDVPCDELFVPSDGRPGGGKRVTKLFPRIDDWGGEVVWYVLDDLIPKDVFERALRSAGQLVGIGRFRPQNRGYYGRFVIESIDWVEDDAAEAIMMAAGA